MKIFSPLQNRLKFIIIAFVSAAAVVFASLFFVAPAHSEPVSQFFLGHSYALVIDGRDFPLEIANTAPLQHEGLSGRADLPSDSGMLFVMNEPQYIGIWMKDMQFPIDIIWLNADREIVTIERGVTPDTYPEVFYPADLSQYVLETNAGFVESHGLQLGDSLEFVER